MVCATPSPCVTEDRESREKILCNPGRSRRVSSRIFFGGWATFWRMGEV